MPVTDRGRFQKAKRFDYVDTQLLPGAVYHYRIVAFTTDGYFSTPPTRRRSSGIRQGQRVVLARAGADRTALTAA